MEAAGNLECTTFSLRTLRNFYEKLTFFLLQIMKFFSLSLFRYTFCEFDELRGCWKFMNIFRILMSLEIDEFSGMKLMKVFEWVWVNWWWFWEGGRGWWCWIGFGSDDELFVQQLFSCSDYKLSTAAFNIPEIIFLMSCLIYGWFCSMILIFLAFLHYWKMQAVNRVSSTQF
jgi:hypothetical protein